MCNVSVQCKCKHDLQYCSWLPYASIGGSSALRGDTSALGMCSVALGSFRGYVCLSDLGTSAFFHMSNSPGVVVFCTTRFD